MQKMTVTLALFIMFALASCNIISKDKSKDKNAIDKSTSELEENSKSYCKENMDATKALKVKKVENFEDYIIPSSDRKLLTSEVLDSLDKSDLDYARNEIYARHGYIFKIKKYRDYFLKKTWYSTDKNFSENNFNEIEERNLKIIDNYVNSMSKLVLEVNDNYGNYDLDGNGIKEKVTLVFQDNSTKFTLNVNSLSISQNGTNFRNTMFLYDIDSNDKFREVAVVDEKSKGNCVTSFYDYDGLMVKLIGTIPGSYNSIKITGNGKLKTAENSKILLGWTNTLLYYLVDSKLEYKPSSLYEINSKVKMKENVVIQTTKLSLYNTFELKKGEEVTLMNSDNVEWISIKNSEGKIGWLKLKEANKINGKDIKDIFIGIED